MAMILLKEGRWVVETRRRTKFDKYLEGFRQRDVVESRRRFLPGVGECACGRVIFLRPKFCGACKCDCGRWYNVFGQQLPEPKYWVGAWEEDPLAKRAADTDWRSTEWEEVTSNDH